MLLNNGGSGRYKLYLSSSSPSTQFRFFRYIYINPEDFLNLFYLFSSRYSNHQQQGKEGPDRNPFDTLTTLVLPRRTAEPLDWMGIMSQASDLSDFEKDVGAEKAIERGTNLGHEEHDRDQQDHDQDQYKYHDFGAAQTSFAIPDANRDGSFTGDRNNDGTADLEQVASEKPSINNIKSVPNGGFRAWMQVVGVFFIFLNSWGIVNTFGTYQTYYELDLLKTSSPSNISWIGSIQATLLLFVGSLAGPIYDAGYVHSLLFMGSFLVVFGQMMLSLCTSYWQVMLAQGVSIGMGSGLLFVPGVAILSTYFSTKLATAVGLAAAGSSIGGVIYPIIIYKLQPTVGFAWATRVLGFIMLGTLIISNLVIRVRVLPAARRSFLDLTVFKEPAFMLYTVGMFLAFIGLYTPFFYSQSYALETKLAGPNLAFYLLAVINATSTFGRIIPNYIADKIGPLNMVFPCALGTAIMCLCLIPARSIASLIVVLALFGFTSGALVSLPAACIVSLTTNRARIGTRMGMSFAFVSMGLLIGTPVGGSILRASSFTYLWVYAGVAGAVGAILILLARIMQGGTSLMVKV